MIGPSLEWANLAAASFLTPSESDRFEFQPPASACRSVTIRGDTIPKETIKQYLVVLIE